jgi:putative selenium metabolism protein SsnA
VLFGGKKKMQKRLLLLRGGTQVLGKGAKRELVRSKNAGVLLDTRSGVIVDVSRDCSGQRENSDLQIVDVADSDLVMPGLINAHGHFYGMYARGMSLGDGVAPPSSFGDVLAKLWWRLDRALDPRAVELSALVGLVAAVRNGCTTIVDHHSSPSCVDGSLARIGDAAARAGVRVSLAYEVSDRNGVENARAGIAENVRVIQHAIEKRDGMVGASFGLHASFTVSDATLASCVDALQAIEGARDVGFHVHVAEGAIDEEHSVRAHGRRTVHRLRDAGVLRRNSLLGHGVYMDDDEMRLVASHGAMVACNIESNCNNGVGVPRVEDMLDAGIVAGVGTDGMSYAMLGEFSSAYLAHKLSRGDPRAMPGDRLATMLLDHNAAMADRLMGPFGAPALGTLEVGAAADVIVASYCAPTPLVVENFPWHLIFGDVRVHTTVARGRMLMHQNRLLTLDEEYIAKQARAHAPRVWSACHKFAVEPVET